MTARAASWLAWSLAGLSVALFAAQILLYVLALSVPVPERWDTSLSVVNLLGNVLFLIFPVVGALIASRQPRNPVGWVLLADGLMWSFNNMLSPYVVYALAVPGSLPFPLGAAAFNNWLWVPSIGLLGTYVFLLFPDGRLPSRRWRPVAWLSGLVVTAVSAGVALDPGPMEDQGGLINAFGILPAWITPFLWITLSLLPLCMVASAASLVFRYRRSRGMERQQIKWIAFAAAFVGLLYLIAMALSLIFPGRSWFVPAAPLWMDVIDFAALLSFLTIPVAVGFAMLRYRLYDIDIIINRTLVYGALSATLALIYLSGVATVQTTFRTLTGQEQQPQLAIVASTLAIAALFNPLRGRIQSFIDRRFYRRKYDAHQTLEAYSARLRDETDLQELNVELTRVVRETVEPAYASLWLRPGSGDSPPK